MAINQLQTFAFVLNYKCIISHDLQKLPLWSNLSGPFFHPSLLCTQKRENPLFYKVVDEFFFMETMSFLRRLCVKTVEKPLQKSLFTLFFLLLTPPASSLGFLPISFIVRPVWHVSFHPCTSPMCPRCSGDTKSGADTPLAAAYKTAQPESSLRTSALQVEDNAFLSSLSQKGRKSVHHAGQHLWNLGNDQQCEFWGVHDCSRWVFSSKLHLCD